MSTHNNTENKGDPKLLPAIIQKKQESQDIQDMARAEGEGFNEPAQLESIDEADARDRKNLDKPDEKDASQTPQNKP